MDIISVNCKYYVGDMKGTCTNERRKTDKLFLEWFKIGKHIPICPEINCGICNWKEELIGGQDPTIISKKKIKKEV